MHKTKQYRNNEAKMEQEPELTFDLKKRGKVWNTFQFSSQEKSYKLNFHIY